jgi:Asp-tRNA(Asn)/Glu-tRNA(Gln) amidotransferase A subunit family amidase
LAAWQGNAAAARPGACLAGHLGHPARPHIGLGLEEHGAGDGLVVRHVHEAVGEFRVAVWASSPLCRIDTSVSDLFDRAINAIVRAGATVDDAARPGIADEEHHRLFMLLLRAATASRMRDEDFAR